MLKQHKKVGIGEFKTVPPNGIIDFSRKGIPEMTKSEEQEREERRKLSTKLMLLMQMRSSKFDMNKLTSSEKELIEPYKEFDKISLQKEIKRLNNVFVMA